jgi:hypothetical protein
MAPYESRGEGSGSRKTYDTLLVDSSMDRIEGQN